MKNTIQRLALLLLGAVCSIPASAQLSRQDIDRLREEIRGRGYHFRVSQNPATQLPIDQLCGLKPPSNWQQNAPMTTLDSVQKPPTLPARFDWRDTNALTPIRNQGSCGGCWSFASLAPMESAILRTTGASVDLSEQWLVSCVVDSNHHGCDGGWWAHDALQQQGAVPEYEFPYVAWNAPCGGPYTHPYRWSSWSYVPTGVFSSIPKVDDIKDAIYTYGPITAGVYVGPAFQAYSDGLFDINEVTDPSTQINHGITLVGWDDNMGSGAWILRNSWGTWWGESGYMYISYTSNLVGYGASYGVLAPVTPGSIHGTVRSTTGTPIAGADISTTTGGYSTASDYNGNYTISNVTVGTYNITASKLGYNPHTVTGITVNSGSNTLADIDLTPIPPSNIAQAKSQPDGTVVRITGIISASFADSFYIIDDLNTPGIRVSATTTAPEGSMLTVSGPLQTTNGERSITDPYIE